GGSAVTVTDANLLLGRLNPDRLTGVEESAPMETIAAAIHEQTGAPLGLDATAAAAAVLAVTTNQLGARDPLGVGREGTRSAGFCLIRLWRRRAVACRRDRPRARHSDRAGAAVSRHHLRSGLRPSASAARFCPECRPTARRCGDRRDRRPLR